MSPPDLQAVLMSIWIVGVLWIVTGMIVFYPRPPWFTPFVLGWPIILAVVIVCLPAYCIATMLKYVFSDEDSGRDLY